MQFKNVGGAGWQRNETLERTTYGRNLEGASYFPVAMNSMFPCSNTENVHDMFQKHLTKRCEGVDESTSRRNTAGPPYQIHTALGTSRTASFRRTSGGRTEKGQNEEGIKMVMPLFTLLLSITILISQTPTQ